MPLRGGFIAGGDAGGPSKAAPDTLGRARPSRTRWAVRALGVSWFHGIGGETRKRGNSGAPAEWRQPSRRGAGQVGRVVSFSLLFSPFPVSHMGVGNGKRETGACRPVSGAALLGPPASPPALQHIAQRW